MKYGLHIALAAALVGSLAVPAVAEWAVMKSDISVKVAKGTMTVKPGADWNRSTLRPSRRSEAWTRDGVNLNELTFFGAIGDGETLLRQGWATSEKLPKFKSDMVLTDIAELFEKTNRLILQSPVFKMGKVEPAKLGKHDGVRFGYSYAAQAEDIERKGEAVAAIIEGRLYMINYVAPSLHYFDAGIGDVRVMIEGIEVSPPKPVDPAAAKKKKKRKPGIYDIMIETKKM